MCNECTAGVQGMYMRNTMGFLCCNMRSEGGWNMNMCKILLGSAHTFTTASTHAHSYVHAHAYINPFTHTHTTCHSFSLQ